MSSATQPAYIHNGSWDEKSRTNPAMKWLEDFTVNDFDTKDWAKCAQATVRCTAIFFTSQALVSFWLLTTYLRVQTSDFVYHKGDGNVFSGRDAAWKQIAQDYAPFPEQKHEPFFLLAWETDEEWHLMGEVNVYFKLPAPLPETETDLAGKKWHVHAFGAYHFIFINEDGGIRMKSTRIYADQSPVMKRMLKSNIISGEQVVGMLSS